MRRSYKRTLRSFWFHKSYKNDRISQKKERKRTVRSFLRLKKNLTFFFAIYIYIYIYIFIYLYISIYLYIFLYRYIDILKKRTQPSAFFCVLLQKNKTFSHSFTFFAKELNILCVLLRFLQKNVAFSVFFYSF